MYRRNNSQRNLIITLLVVSVVGMSIGFAALSNVLTISSSVNVAPSDATFNVDFSSSATSVVANDITPTTNPNTLNKNKAKIDNSASPTLTNLQADFTEPGQTVTYKLYAYNAGEYDAYLTSITYNNVLNETKPIVCTPAAGTTASLAEEACKGLVVTVTVGDKEVTKTEDGIKGHVLRKGTSEEVIIEIEYKSGSGRADGNIEVEFGDITLVYSSVDSDGTINIGGGSGTNYLCKRADVSTLHTETCNQSSTSTAGSGVGCVDAGYTIGETITYGNQTTTDGALTPGDAFDCDVDGDETYDSDTERFYYVSPKDADDESEYAVLIYYNNTTNGYADNTSASKIEYDSSEENWHGPVTAIKNLPTIQEWTNVSLSRVIRAITNENGGNTTSGGTLPTNFSYTNSEGIDYAARLLTYQELVIACGGTSLDNCAYLMENTDYSLSRDIWGYWLENPEASYSYTAWGVRSHYSSLQHGVVYNELGLTYGVRPVIEVLKTDIQY